MAKLQNKNFQNYFFYFFILILVGLFVFYGFKNPKSLPKSSIQSAIIKKTVEFISNNLVGGKVELKNTEEVSGVYKLNLKIQNEEVPVYLSKDGKLLFLQVLNLEESLKQSSQRINKCEDIKKETQPILEAFVVSQCPFGLQMQRIFNEVRKNIPQLEPYLIIRYIGEIKDNKITAMHGEEEAQENLRQICIREEQKDKFWSYIECYIQEGKSQECLKLAKINEEKLKECLEDSSRGLNYAKKDFGRQDLFKAQGSPTLIVNNQEVSEFGFGGRTAEAIKQIICCAFKEKPSYCEKTLTTNEASTGFSKDYSSGNTSSGSCQ